MNKEIKNIVMIHYFKKFYKEYFNRNVPSNTNMTIEAFINLIVCKFSKLVLNEKIKQKMVLKVKSQSTKLIDLPNVVGILLTLLLTFLIFAYNSDLVSINTSHNSSITILMNKYNQKTQPLDEKAIQSLNNNIVNQNNDMVKSTHKMNYKMAIFFVLLVVTFFIYVLLAAYLATQNYYQKLFYNLCLNVLENMDNHEFIENEVKNHCYYLSTDLIFEDTSMK